jgi:hypothetical protein
MCFGDDRARGALRIAGRTPSGIDGGREVWVRADRFSTAWLPVDLMGVLEDHGWALRLHAAVRVPAGAAEAAQLNALIVTWPAADEDRRAEALAAFPLAPSAVIDGARELPGDGGATVDVIFGLTEPVTLPESADLARALLARLAATLGADPVSDTVDLAGLSVPLPGTMTREVRPRLVTALCVHPERRYSVRELMAATEPAAPTATIGGRHNDPPSPATAGRRRSVRREHEEAR